MSYASIQTRNEWGYEYSFVDKQELNFNSGDEVRVRWPNGEKSIETIVRGVNYHNSYNVRSPSFSFQYDVNGVEIRVDLYKVGVHKDDLKLGRELPEHIWRK
ncbi:hypothetical protein HOA92_03280 [archaeon]|jgi:hypothetical protein|nr:hypothetical protein [archaeon]MBT6762036.1 hypothetical protein [archaeon]